VKGTIPYDDVLAKIKKTGKEVGAWACHQQICSSYNPPYQVRSGVVVE